MQAINRNRPLLATGPYSKFHGEYRASFVSGLVTVAAAATSSAGHMFVMRNPSTTKKVIVRYVNAQFATTTAMGTAQAMGYGLHVTRGATAVYTGGTAIDMFTVTGSQKMRADQELTLFTTNNVRIATTAGLTVPGTQDFDAHPLSAKYFAAPALAGVADVTLLDARDDGGSAVRSPLVLGYQECLVITNLILMGATGVGYFAPTIEWDEVTP
jgi:hypothetical protein